MFDWLRKIVAGPKNRLVNDKYDLDLTYIATNVIAMAFPASGLEKAYRNCVEDVAQYLEERHKGRYFIINVSNRQYDLAPFEGRVKSYEWEDHQAPCLTTLFEVAQFAYRHLRGHQQNVVAFHCNHGKGRTGTAVMSLLMYMQDFEGPKEVLDYYNEKRFKTKKYVVSQPCQLRYLRFYDAVLKNVDDYPHLKAYRLVNIQQQGLTGSHYLKITQVRSSHLTHSKARMGEQPAHGAFLMGDVFIELMKEGIVSDSRVSRINYHMQFAKQSGQKWTISLDGPTLTLESCTSGNFSLSIQFQLYCSCHLRQKWSAECECFRVREKEEWHWSKMQQIVRQRPGRHHDFTFGHAGSEQPLQL